MTKVYLLIAVLVNGVASPVTEFPTKDMAECLRISQGQSSLVVPGEEPLHMVSFCVEYDDE